VSEHFNTTDDLVIDFDKERMVEPSFTRLRAHVRGQILFVGHYWITVPEARALRDYLNQVLP
jgi:hypothetical protein